MDANSFYQKYGQYIARVQQNTTRWSLRKWPYINPRLLKGDLEVTDPALSPYFLPYGIHYDWYLSAVIYRPGRITYVPLPYGPYSVISFEFSGCWMAKICFRGAWYAFHISTSRTPQYDCKLQWRRFLSQYKSHISSIVMFQPTALRDLFDKSIKLHGDGRPATLAGLIAEDNTCYTLVYDYMSARVVTATDARTDYIGQCFRDLLCDEQDLIHYSRL